MKKYIVSSMPPPPIDAEKDEKNFYALMPSSDVERLKKGLLLFKSATNYRHEIQEVDLSGVNWGDVTTSRMEIDSAKIPSVCRLAHTDLTLDPNCKVLIFCNYKRDMETAKLLLQRYKPLVMDGGTSEKQRLEITEKFQSDNNNYRVIITNPKVGGIGIDLDDKHGTHPRIAYLLPSYFFTDQCQATGRIHREGTLSKATIRFVYSRAFPYETGILNSMAIKSNVLRNMVTNDHNTLVYPGEYDELLELTPEEIKNGVNKNVVQELITFEEEKQKQKEKEKEEMKVPYYKTKRKIHQLEINYRSPLDEDKYHAYCLFLEKVDNNLEKVDNNLEEAIKEATKLMYENVSERLSEEVKEMEYEFDNSELKTEEDLINFIEGFHM